ncbi:MAG: GTP-binding protein [Gemmatimonadaceae bacterium]
MISTRFGFPDLDRHFVTQLIGRVTSRKIGHLRSMRPMARQRTPHLIVIGGFLGAGKTTAIQRLGDHLTEQGIRLAVVTNDQGSQLVDSHVMRACGFETREVAGGCFCCRFDDLASSVSYLTSEMGPDVLIAEAVGSCTDLTATVTYPLSRTLGGRCSVAPLSVFVDPVRARRVFGLDHGARFSSDVEYIYKKQLEEADVLVISKCDLVSDEEINELGNALAGAYSAADVVAVSSRDGLQLDQWFHRVLYGVQRERPTMTVDYATYAAGEARLGWLNAALVLRAPVPVDATDVLLRLADGVRLQLASEAIEVGHLKMTVVPADAPHQAASVNLVRTDDAPQAGARLAAPITAGRLTVNLRGEADPARLRAALEQAISQALHAERIDATIETIEAFRPDPPVPTHRVTVAAP